MEPYFGIHLLCSSLLLSCIIGILLLFQFCMKEHLTGKLRCGLWKLLLLFLAVPFLPSAFLSPVPLFLKRLSGRSFASAGTLTESTLSGIATGSLLFPDYAVEGTSSLLLKMNRCILLLWGMGMLFMLLLMLRARLRFTRLFRSALPLQNPEIRMLFSRCQEEILPGRSIRLYSTAFLDSPVAAGLIHPCIYVPIRMLQDTSEEQLRHIFLHELQHFRQRDPLIHLLMNAAGILYWFHPLVRLALQKLHLSQELACDLAVLNHLPTSECTAYGRTLLHFTASRTMQHHFFYSGLADRDSQLKQRIHQIASYHPLTFPQKCRNAFILLTAVCFFISAAPFLSLQAAGAPVEDGIFLPEPSVTELKASSLFQERDRSFVFYDPQTEHWQIYNRELAARRSSPDSTYKIYSALAALQEDVITPEDSSRQWDRTEHFFAAWNQDQTLRSAMQYSVNWYFQNLDRSTGYASLSRFFRRIGYGNQDLSGGLSSFWLESSLQISPQEQVLLLKDFYQNTWGLPQKQIDTVKDSLYLTEYHGRRLYGKTGTGIKDGKEINGWFIGFTETDTDVYFFAVNLQASDNASGQTAGEIALSYLQEMGL